AAIEQSGETKYERAGDLPLDLCRIDGCAGIGGGDDAMHFDLVTVGDGDFGDGSGVACEPHLLGDTAKQAFGRGLMPADTLRDRIEDGEMLRMIRHQLAAECER